MTSSQKQGAVEFVELLSQAGGRCRLQNPWREADVTLYRNGNKSESLSGSDLEFAAVKGEVIVLVRSGTTPAQYKRIVL